MHLEVWDRSTSRCADCGGERVLYTGAAERGEVTVAVFAAFLYDHPGNPEVFTDVTFGSWGEGADYADHLTFGSRTGFLDEHPHFASSLVTGGAMAPDTALVGHKVTRDEALGHQRLDEFWEISDRILEGVEEIGGMFQRGGRGPDATRQRAIDSNQSARSGSRRRPWPRAWSWSRPGSSR